MRAQINFLSSNEFRLLQRWCMTVKKSLRLLSCSVLYKWKFHIFIFLQILIRLNAMDTYAGVLIEF